jgi:hypothetical protein
MVLDDELATHNWEDVRGCDAIVTPAAATGTLLHRKIFATGNAIISSANSTP